MEPTTGTKGTFRSEALAAEREKFQGEPAMDYPLSLSWFGWILAALTVLVLAFLALADYTRYTRATAIVTPASGITVHVAGQEGTVFLAPATQAGARIGSGELFARVDASAAVEAAGDIADAGLSQLASKRDSLLRADNLTGRSSVAQVEAISAQSRLLDAQIARAAQQRELAGERLRIKEAELKRNSALQRDGYVSAQSLSVLHSEVATLRVDSAEAEQRISALRQQAMALRQQEIDIRDRSRADSERYSQEVSELDSRIASARSNRRVELRANEAQTITAVHVESGNYVSINTPIVTTANPQEPLRIRALVGARAVAGLRTGTEVRIRYDAFPYYYFGTFSGRVVSVDRSPWRGTDKPAGQENEPPLYRVLVEPRDQRIESPQGSRPLLAGMTAQVEIPEYTRSLLQWILLPSRNY